MTDKIPNVLVVDYGKVRSGTSNRQNMIRFYSYLTALIMTINLKMNKSQNQRTCFY